MITKFLKFGLKCGVVGGAVYASARYGVWSPSTQEGAEILKEFRESVIPEADEYIKQVPRMEDVRKSFTSSRKAGMQWVADGLTSLPDKAYEGVKKGGDVAYKNLFPASEK